jgi:hypothetical protein
MENRRSASPVATRRRARRITRRLLPLLGAGGLAFGLTLGVAGAASTIPLLGSFGSPGGGGGHFALPRGVAVDQSTGPSRGDVYVADQNNRRVDKFDAAGDFILAFGHEVNETKVKAKESGASVTEAEEDICTLASGDVCRAGVAGTGAGQFSIALGVAVDPSSGDVYVVDFSNHRVEKFGAGGEFLLAFGKGVDVTSGGDLCTAASGDECGAGKAGTGEDEFEWTLGSFIAVGASGTVYVGDENRVQEFAPTGKHSGLVALPGVGKITALAVDDGGDIYAASPAHAGLRKYGAGGEQLAEFDAGTEGSQLKGVAIAPTSGEVFLLDGGAGLRVRRYTAAGALAAESEGGRLKASNGVASTGAGTVYASDSEDTPEADRVLILGEPPTEGNPPPAIDAQSVGQAAEESASLEAQINPHFLQTHYRVQYVPASGYEPLAADPYAGPGGCEAPSAAGITLGGGAIGTDQPARVALNGLTPGSIYHFRFVAKSSAGVSYGPDQSFTTFAPGGPSGLPDGRAYEQVSAAQKNGNEAGVELNGTDEPIGAYAYGSADGSRVAYIQIGPAGETSSGADLYSVAAREPTGWATSAAVPPEDLANGDFLGQKPLAFLASSDLSRFLFVATGPFAAGNSATNSDENLGLYRTRGNAAQPEWLSAPTLPFSEAKPKPGEIPLEGVYPVGGSSPDLGTSYFTYFGTLVPEDASRAPLVETTNTNGPWGFYERSEGQLHSASVLPADSPYPNEVDPYGAVPAATLNATGSTQRQPFKRFLLGEVSEDGTKAFFVSPQPIHAAEAGTPVELYVREQTPSGAKTVLVSRDELTGGSPAPGSGTTRAVTPVRTQWAPDDYVYGSPDGSRAFFESMDKLAKSAAGAEPEGEGPWTYEFDLAGETLTYLPGVAGPIAASSKDGSSFIFLNAADGQIELWAGGPAPVEVASFQRPSAPEFEGAATSDGGVFVFDTNAVLKRGSQTFNDSAEAKQSYRFDVSSGSLSCVSCSPAGTPQRPVEAETSAHPRLLADEGGRVFFATAAKLVARDVNGVNDVYEWERDGVGGCHSQEAEDGCIYLISSGVSPDPSFYLENDESGDNVFFATREGLQAGDTDEAYDVYDARVGGGFRPPATPPECGSACRTQLEAPSLPTFLTTTLSPFGNLTPPAAASSSEAAEPTPKPSVKPSRAQLLAKALKACRHKPKRQRAACVKHAKLRYSTNHRPAAARRGRRR